MSEAPPPLTPEGFAEATGVSRETLRRLEAYAACLVGAVIGCLAYLARTATLLGIGKEPEGWTTEAGVH